MFDLYPKSGYSAETTKLTIRVFRDLTSLDPIAAAWDDLVFRLTGRPPTTSHAWVASHLEQRLSFNHPWFCLAAFDENTLVGVLPLGERPRRVVGQEAVQLVQPGEPSMHAVDAVIIPGRELEVLTAFRTALDDLVPNWFGLELKWIDHLSPLLASGIGLPPRTFGVRHAVGQEATVPTGTETSYGEFRSRLNRKFRSETGRSLRKLERERKVDIQYLTGAEAKPRHLLEFMAIESAGWKGTANSSIGKVPYLTRLFQAICRRLFARGVLEWHFLRVDGQGIAGHLAVRTGRTLVIPKSGYDENFASFSPGFILMEKVIERAFADPEIDTVSFVTDQPYHVNWRPVRRPYYHLWLYPNHVRSFVVGALPKQVWQGLRRVPGLRIAAAAVRRKSPGTIQSRRQFLSAREHS